MKSLSEYQAALEAVLAYRPTTEYTKKVLGALGVEYREDPRWSLPLRLTEHREPHEPFGSWLAITDADEAIVADEIRMPGMFLANLQRILAAANAELARQAPSPPPLFVRQGDSGHP